MQFSVTMFVPIRASLLQKRVCSPVPLTLKPVLRACLMRSADGPAGGGGAAGVAGGGTGVAVDALESDLAEA